MSPVERIRCCGIGERRRRTGFATGVWWLLPAATVFNGFLMLLPAQAQSPTDGRSPFSITLSGRTVSVIPGMESRTPIAKIRFESEDFTVPAGFEGDPRTPPDARSATSTRDGYLFIDSNNGGNGWRSGKRNVFAIRNGSLIYLGDIAADLPESVSHLENKLFLSRTFLDVDNQLENNRLTSHARAPEILVALKDLNGKFVYDARFCWRLNAPRYAIESRTIADTGDAADFRAAMLFASAIDTYCSRTQALASDLLLARHRLPGSEYGELLMVLRTLKVGQRPTR